MVDRYDPAGMRQRQSSIAVRPKKSWWTRRNNDFPPTVAEAIDILGAHDRRPGTGHRGARRLGANRTVGGPVNIGKTGYTQFKGVRTVDGAGHWAHEEKPEQASELLTVFLREHA